MNLGISLFPRCGRVVKHQDGMMGQPRKLLASVLTFSPIWVQIWVTISILVLFDWGVSSSPLKAEKFASSTFKATVHHYKSFQTSVAWKEARPCGVWGQQGSVEEGCPDAALQRPFPCRQAARRLLHLFLHIPAGFCCFQLLWKASQERTGTGLVREQEKLGVWRLSSTSVGTLTPLSHQRQINVRVDPLTLGTVAENSLL